MEQELMEIPITQAMNVCGRYGDKPSLIIQSSLIEIEDSISSY
jgi:hypothetical protein